MRQKVWCVLQNILSLSLCKVLQMVPYTHKHIHIYLVLTYIKHMCIYKTYVATHEIERSKYKEKIKKYEECNSFSFNFLLLMPAVKTGLKYNYRKTIEMPILNLNIFFLNSFKWLKALMSSYNLELIKNILNILSASYNLEITNKKYVIKFQGNNISCISSKRTNGLYKITYAYHFKYILINVSSLSACSGLAS